MRIHVRVTPRAKHPSVIIDSKGTFQVKVIAAAEAGRANDAVREALAAHFHVPKSTVTIVQGRGSRQKLVEVVG